MRISEALRCFELGVGTYTEAYINTRYRALFAANRYSSVKLDKLLEAKNRLLSQLRNGVLVVAAPLASSSISASSLPPVAAPPAPFVGADTSAEKDEDEENVFKRTRGDFADDDLDEGKPKQAQEADEPLLKRKKEDFANDDLDLDEGKPKKADEPLPAAAFSSSAAHGPGDPSVLAVAIRNPINQDLLRFAGVQQHKHLRTSNAPADRVTPLMLNASLDETPIEVIPVEGLDPNDSVHARIVKDPRKLPLRDKHRIITVAVDLDETLVCARSGPMHIRPYARRFLAALECLRGPIGEQVEVIVWSAGEPVHVGRCLQVLDPLGLTIKYAIPRDKSWVLSSPPLKNISLLPGRGNSTVLVDDSPYVAVDNGTAAIVIPCFLPEAPLASNDTTLLYTLQVIARAFHCMAHIRHPHRGIDSLIGAGKYVNMKAPVFSAALRAIAAGDNVAQAAAKSAIVAQQSGIAQIDKLAKLCDPEMMKLEKRKIASYITDHPFMVFAECKAFGATLSYLHLDVAQQSVVQSRIEIFRAFRIRDALDSLVIMTLPRAKSVIQSAHKQLAVFILEKVKPILEPVLEPIVRILTPLCAAGVVVNAIDIATIRETVLLNCQAIASSLSKLDANIRVVADKIAAIPSERGDDIVVVPATISLAVGSAAGAAAAGSSACGDVTAVAPPAIVGAVAASSSPAVDVAQVAPAVAASSSPAVDVVPVAPAIVGSVAASSSPADEIASVAVGVATVGCSPAAGAESAADSSLVGGGGVAFPLRLTTANMVLLGEPSMDCDIKIKRWREGL